MLLRAEADDSQVPGRRTRDAAAEAARRPGTTEQPGQRGAATRRRRGIGGPNSGSMQALQRYSEGWVGRPKTADDEENPGAEAEAEEHGGHDSALRGRRNRSGAMNSLMRLSHHRPSPQMPAIKARTAWPSPAR